MEFEKENITVMAGAVAMTQLLKILFSQILDIYFTL
jgi:hypothetical protein